MKKLIILLFVFLMFCPVTTAFADDEIYSNKEIVRRRKLIEKVGYQILNANRIDKRITFQYNHKKKETNAYATYGDRRVIVTKGMMDLLDTEDELAAVLGHEISHNLDHYKGILRGFFSFTIFRAQSRINETRADLRSVDFLVNAGYNPVAEIIVLHKFLSQPRYEWYSTHPLGSKRLAKIYEHIYLKYPYFLVNNEYIKNPVYQNFLLTSKENRLLLKDALEKEKNKGKFKQPRYN